MRCLLLTWKAKPFPTCNRHKRKPDAALCTAYGAALVLRCGLFTNLIKQSTP